MVSAIALTCDVYNLSVLNCFKGVPCVCSNSKGNTRVGWWPVLY